VSGEPCEVLTVRGIHERQETQSVRQLVEQHHDQVVLRAVFVVEPEIEVEVAVEAGAEIGEALPSTPAASGSNEARPPRRRRPRGAPCGGRGLQTSGPVSLICQGVSWFSSLVIRLDHFCQSGLDAACRGNFGTHDTSVEAILMGWQFFLVMKR
jgi:hypothetical protein